MKVTFFTIFLLFLAFQTSYAQWSEQTSPVTTELKSISAVDNNNVWICGAAGKVLRTTNGGTNWVSVSSPNAALTLYNVWGVNSDTALVSGTSTSTFVYQTTNGGASWTQVFAQPGGFIDGITQRVSIEKLLMVGNPVGGRWSIWESTDCGLTWDSSFILIQAGAETGLNNSLYIHPQLSAWFGTNNTRVYRRTGGSYIAEPTPGLGSSASIWFNDGLNGMAGGSILLATTDAGSNWTTVTAPGTGTILGITGGAADWWYVRGSAIYYSPNNGVSWTTDFTPPAGTYNHISMSRTGQSMWAVRTNGGISTSLGPIGIQPISNEIPQNFSLLQNYPNPFNPSTKIRFEIPASGSVPKTVRLVIYDVLGKEVTSLVNEKLKAGDYEVSWDASAYPSGAYFYSLTAEGFSQTKKLILLK